MEIIEVITSRPVEAMKGMLLRKVARHTHKRAQRLWVADKKISAASWKAISVCAAGVAYVLFPKGR